MLNLTVLGVLLFLCAPAFSQIGNVRTLGGELSPAQRLLSGSEGTVEDNLLMRRPFNKVDERNARRSPDVLRQRDVGDDQKRESLDDAWDDETPLYEDFSRYIRETTGKIISDALPLKHSDSKHQKLHDAYQLGVGDEVEIQIWGAINGHYRLVVNEAGRVFVPEVGSIPLEGVRAGDLTSVVTGYFRRIYKSFELRAFAVGGRGVVVSVSGHAQSVGIKNVDALDTLISAALTHARPARGGSRRFIELQRRGEAPRVIDLYCFFRGSCDAIPTTLKNDDAIRIPLRSKLVAIGGAVSRPGIYELAPSETMDDLLLYAGGVSVIADPEKVNAYSFGKAGSADRLFKKVSLSGFCGRANVKGCMPLSDGDYLDVQSRLALVKGAVTLVVPGVDPIKHEFRPGTRLLDVLSGPFDRLIPGKTLEALNAGSFATLSDLDERLKRLDLGALILYRLDVQSREYSSITIDYKAAMTEGAASPSNVQLNEGDVLVVDDQKDWKSRRDELPMSVQVLGEVAKPGRYRFVGTKTLAEVMRMAGGTTPTAAVWSAVILREGDGRSTVNREMLKRTLAAISEQQARQEAVNRGDKSAPPAKLPPRQDAVVARAQLSGGLVKKEMLELMQGRDLVFLSSRDNLDAVNIRLTPNDIVLVPPVQDTFSCEGAFFKVGEFMVGTGSISLVEAQGRCGLISEMNPNVYHFVSRENRICRVGWFSSCPMVESGDVVVAVPEAVTRTGWTAAMDWLDFTFKSLTTLATLKVLSR